MLLQRALAINPNHQAALEQLTEHHLLAQKFKEALEVARRTIAIYPQRYSPYLLACRAAADLCDTENAIKFLDQADERAGPHPEIRAMRASFFMQHRDWNTAYQLLLDPEAQVRRYACLWTLLVRLLIVTGDYDRALATLPTKVSSAHDLSRKRLLEAQIAEARFDLGQAMTLYREVLQLTPGDSGAHFNLARASLNCLDLDTCRRYLSQAVRITGSSEPFVGNH